MKRVVSAEDAPQSAGESSHFGRVSAFESSPLGGTVMTFYCRTSPDIKCSKSCVTFLFLNTAGGLCKRNIHSKNVFPVLNIIDYSLYFRVYFKH